MSADPIKDALHRLAYGFYSITSRHGDVVNAMVGNWLTQVSFTPRLVMFGLSKKAYSHEVIAAGGVFAVNIFNKGDQAAMMPFTKAHRRQPEKMSQAVWTPGPMTGCPILEGAAAYVECRVVSLVDVGGDHDLLVGEVVGGDILKPGDAATTLTLVDVSFSYGG